MKRAYNDIYLRLPSLCRAKETQDGIRIEYQSGRVEILDRDVFKREFIPADMIRPGVMVRLPHGLRGVIVSSDFLIAIRDVITGRVRHVTLDEVRTWAEE